MKEIGNSLELLYLKGHEAIQVPCRGEGADIAPNTCESFREVTLKDQERSTVRSQPVGTTGESRLISSLGNTRVHIVWNKDTTAKKGHRQTTA